MDDLVKRLRDSFVYDQQHYAPDPLVNEAADALETQAAEIAKLRAELAGAREAALEEAAKVADEADRWEGATVSEVATAIRALKGPAQ
jgi:hypothetical protein